MDDINKCCLCRQNNANQTGSHILPFSLIKEAVNQEGKISRDFEIAYSMSKNEFDENYFGRNVTPEKIKEEVGKEMTDKDVSQNINPFIKDNFLCSFCEKRLEKLESLFASSVYHKLSDKFLASKNKDSKGNTLLELDLYQKKLLYLISYSIFWRCSATNFGRFSLKPEIQESLRKILKDNLLDEQKGFNNHILSLDFNVFKYPLIVYYLDTPSTENETGNIIRISNTKIPYHIWLNKMLLQLYARPKQVGASVEYFFGLFRHVNIKEYVLLNNHNNSFSITGISNERRKEALENIFINQAKNRIEFVKSIFIELYKTVFKDRPHESLISEVVEVYISISENEKEKYTKNLFVNASYIVLKKYYPQRFIDEVV